MNEGDKIMIFSNVNVAKVLYGNSYEENHEIEETTSNDFHRNTNMERLVEHNIHTLCDCHDNKTRYRIRHGIYCGRKVAVVVKAETCLDKLFSYIPSCCLLKRRLSKPIEDFLGEHNSTTAGVIELLRAGGKIPGMSPTEVSSIYSPMAVYNPWPNLPNYLNSNYNSPGKTLSDSDIVNGQAITFYHQNDPYAIFSNMTRRKDKKALALVEVPGVVTTASCSEILFQAGKYHNNPSARKAILKKTSGTDACAIAQKKDSNGKFVEQADEDFFDDDRDVELMLKLVRTRAQQDDAFRKELLDTGNLNIYELTPNDRKWGCVKVPGYTTHSYEGKNLLGQVLMQVRQELRDHKIPEISVEDVIRNRGIEPQNKPTSFEEGIAEKRVPYARGHDTKPNNRYMNSSSDSDSDSDSDNNKTSRFMA